MGTHPIFESDFDCLTDSETDFDDISLCEIFYELTDSINESKNLSEEVHSDRDTSTSGVEAEDIDQQFLSEDSAHDIKYYDQQSNYSSDSMTFLQTEHILGYDCEAV